MEEPRIPQGQFSYLPLHLGISAICIVSLILCIIFLCSSCNAVDSKYYSGHEYIFTAIENNPLYNYTWSASASHPDSPKIYDQYNFVWKAPVVDAPTEVTITLFVSTAANITGGPCVSEAIIKFLVEPLSAITVVKNAIPKDPQAFQFTGSPVIGDFSLYDDKSSDPDPTHNNRTFGELLPGTYSIEEIVPPGWDLTRAVCSDGSPADAIDLGPGENVTVTFTNTKSGHIIVDKVTIPSADSQEFEFQTNYGNSFNLSDASTPNDSGPLSPETYSVTEIPVPCWDTQITSDDGSDPSAIKLSPGETVHITATNTKLTPTVTIETPAVLTCTLTSVTLNATVTPEGSYIYSWKNSENKEIATTEDTTVSSPGTYTLNVTDENGCAASVSVTVTYKECPSLVDSFSGTKFEDKNGNGIMDPDEPGLEGWTINLISGDTVVATATTGPDGNYSFTGILPGAYAVEEVSQDGWSRTYPGPFGIHVVTLVSDVPGPNNIDFGNVRTAGFGGMKFEDKNGNGIMDPDEPGLEDWTINLISGDTVVATATTGPDGNYAFTGILPGAYAVEEVSQDGWSRTYPGPFGIHVVTLVSDVPGPNNIDFGNVRTAGFGGMKFEDKNGNGARDTDEPGLEGWTINLISGDTIVKSATTSTETATLGSYRFTDILPGTYTLVEVPSFSSDWIQTYPADNIYKVVVSETGQITVTRSDLTQVASTNADFGNKYKGSGGQKSPLEITKTTADEILNPYSQATFIITVKNIGNMEIHNIQIVDELSPMLEFILYAYSGNTLIQHKFESGNLLFDLGPLGSLQPGDSWTLAYNVKLNPDACSAVSKIATLPPILAPDETKLKTMAARNGPSNIVQLIDALSRNKTKLEAKLKSIKRERDIFDKANATVHAEIKSIVAANYTLSNFTNTSNGEAISELLNKTTGFVVLSEFNRPDKHDLLVTTYDMKGEAISDLYTFLPTKETLKIEYNKPEKDYRTYTVRYYATGDTLIIIVDPYGNVIRKEYGRTPGVAVPEYLTNCATAYGKMGEIDEEVVSNRACVNLGWNCQSGQPVIGLQLSKKADLEVAKEDDTIEYTYTVENTGTVALTLLTLNDDKLGIIVLNDPDPLEPGESRTYTAYYKVKKGDGPNLANIVTATALDPDGNEVNCEATENVKIIAACLTKTVSPKVVRPGDYVTYNITWYVSGDQIVDDYPRGVSFVSAFPMPVDDGKNNRWIVDGQQNGTIIILVQVAQDIGNTSFNMGQGVTGTGFVNVHNDIRTNPVILKNKATLYEENVEKCTAYADVNVGPPQTYLALKEHGSGDYASEDVIKYQNSNRSTQWTKGLTATHRPTTFSLPNNQEIDFKSKWVEKAKSKNYATGGSTNEEYTYANRISRNSSLKLDENGSTMKTETDFEGVGHIGLVKKDADENRTWNASQIFASQEDYVGSFKINQKFDEYGKNAEYEKSVTGTGYVSARRDLKDAQSSYESGTGNYRSDEKISTVVNYITKDISLTHLPTSYIYTPTFSTSSDIKWKEGMWSKSPTSLISEKFSFAENLDLQSTARGLNEMVSEAGVTGQADFRTVYRDNSPNSTDEIDQEETYVGEFDIYRKTNLGGVAKYDRPHISLCKEARVDLLRTTFADYRITIENNGNRALGPVYVKDVFPAGTEYITSSLRPAELTTSYANWSLPVMGIGSKVIIDMQLNITEESSNLVNRVEAAGKHDSGWTLARNFSTVRLNWLACCPPQISASKTARVDALDPMVVWYSLNLKNREKYTMVAFLMDWLPPTMQLLNSSLEPSENRSNLITWTILNLAPGENRTIVYRTLAKEDGTYVNVAHIEAFSVDGPDGAAVDVEARIDLGAGGVLASSFSSDWQPPTCFGLNCSGQIRSDDWVPCYTCGGGEPGEAMVMPPCASCMDTGDDRLP